MGIDEEPKIKKFKTKDSAKIAENGDILPKTESEINEKLNSDLNKLNEEITGLQTDSTPKNGNTADYKIAKSKNVYLLSKKYITNTMNFLRDLMNTAYIEDKDANISNVSNNE